MSEIFDVTTDYILKGIEPAADKEERDNKFVSQVLFIASTAFVFIGLFCAFGGWYEKQTMEAVWGSMIIQAVGVAAYFIGNLLSTEKAPFCVTWLNVIGIVFMPVSMITGYITILVFKRGWISPYPIDMVHCLTFGVTFLALVVVSFILIRKRTK